jgi:hypothetical protein
MQVTLHIFRLRCSMPLPFSGPPHHMCELHACPARLDIQRRKTSYSNGDSQGRQKVSSGLTISFPPPSPLLPKQQPVAATFPFDAFSLLTLGSVMLCQAICFTHLVCIVAGPPLPLPREIIRSKVDGVWKRYLPRTKH